LISFSRIPSRAAGPAAKTRRRPPGPGDPAQEVAHDDALVRSLAEQILRQFGYTVISAADGDEALARFREEQDRLDLVILDVVMPK
jgi:FixJ family two-component response regulator